MLKKINVKRVFLICLFLIIFLIAVLATWCWYEFFDVSGLVMYQNQEIKDIYVYHSRLYIVTEDGKGYVAGEYSSSNDRKYRNSEFYYNDTLKIPSPVLFFDGKINKIIPLSKLQALFITDNQELYMMSDLTAKKISDSILDACFSSVDNVIYTLDLDGCVWKIHGDSKEKIISADIKRIKCYNNNLYVLCSNGVLCKVIQDIGENIYTLSAPIFEDVVSFDIVDTSVRYNGQKYVFDDGDALSNPLWCVLTQNGNLYAKGYYNLLSCAQILYDKRPTPFYISDWKLIGENVSEFSTAAMGTIMRFFNGECAYYGFDTKVTSESEFKYFELSVVVESVKASDLCLYARDFDGNYYFWGDNLFNAFFRYNNEERSVFYDEPMLIASEDRGRYCVSSQKQDRGTVLCLEEKTKK